MSLNLTDFPYPNIFIVINTVNISVSTTKFDYSFQFDNETYDLTFNYIRHNPIDFLIMKQATSPFVNYVGEMLYYMRINCTDTIYKYLDFQAQLCYDICPFQKYSNSSNFCVKCFKCTDATTCDFCFNNSCIDTTFFDISSLPFKC